MVRRSARLPLPFSSGRHSTSGFPRRFGGQEHSFLCLVLLHRALVPQVPPRWNFPSWSTKQSSPQEPSWQFCSSVQSSSLLQPGRHWNFDKQRTASEMNIEPQIFSSSLIHFIHFHWRNPSQPQSGMLSQEGGGPLNNLLSGGDTSTRQQG